MAIDTTYPCGCCDPKVTDCCPDLALPDTLYAEITAWYAVLGGDCTCLDGIIVAMTWNATLGYWEGDYTTSCGDGGVTLTFSLVCISGGFGLSILGYGTCLGGFFDCGIQGTDSGVTGDIVSCDPLEMYYYHLAYSVFIPSGSSRFCGGCGSSGGCDLDITVTP